jgi:hypothetical protein
VEERKEAQRQLDDAMVRLLAEQRERKRLETEVEQQNLRLVELGSECQSLRNDLRSAHGDLRETIVDRDFLRQQRDAANGEIKFLREQQRRLMQDERSVLDRVREGQSSAVSTLKETAVSQRHRVTDEFDALLRQLSEVQASSESWRSRCTDSHLDVHTRNTMFVAEMAGLLNSVDKFVKESLSSTVQELAQQRKAAEAAAAAEELAAEEQQAQLVAALVDAVKAHDAARSARMASLHSQLGTNNAKLSARLQDVAAKSCEQLTLLGSRGAKFHQSSETRLAEVCDVAGDEVWCAVTRPRMSLCVRLPSSLVLLFCGAP